MSGDVPFKLRLRLRIGVIVPRNPGGGWIVFPGAPLEQDWGHQLLAQGRQPLGGCRSEVPSVLTVDDEGGGPAPVQFADPQLDLGELFVFGISRGELE